MRRLRASASASVRTDVEGGHNTRRARVANAWYPPPPSPEGARRGIRIASPPYLRKRQRVSVAHDDDGVGLLPQLALDEAQQVLLVHGRGVVHVCKRRSQRLCAGSALQTTDNAALHGARAAARRHHTHACRPCGRCKSRGAGSPCSLRGGEEEQQREFVTASLPR